MSTTPGAPEDEELAAALRELGAQLELAPVSEVDGTTERAARDSPLAAALVRLDGVAVPKDAPTAWIGRRPLAPVLVAAATVVLAILLIAPARDAVAGWLGIGGVRITSGEAPTSTPPPASSTDGMPFRAAEVAALQKRVPFTILLVDEEVAGPPARVELDEDASAALVVLHYNEFIVVQLATEAGSAPVLEKVLGPDTSVHAVDVRGVEGIWLTGEPHQIGYVRPDGELDADTVRRAGNVLLWVQGSVTYRIEGLDSLEQSLDVAEALR